MSSDPIESFFGWLRKSAGSNDQTDVRAVLTGIEKTLKTGITSASSTSNIWQQKRVIACQRCRNRKTQGSKPARNSLQMHVESS
ncbi:hypothetical protein HPB49_000678 [Dermacentor silvarum]|uniref:Uncharacterized protein n=1 Tax=Dermacentor silvarum TaxID=543639 RepID=A0ACB8DLL3_DERSI|nr:hypothetical protein HPB49_000678 [Dermacentor silvarum]